MLKNSFYNSLGGVIRLGMGIITIPILIRTLGVEEYGVWILSSSVIAIVMLAEAGLSFSTTFFVSQDIADNNFDELSKTLSFVLVVIGILSTLVSLLIWLNISSILTMFSKLSSSQFSTAEQTLRVGIIVVWTRLLQQVLIGIEQAYEEYRIVNLIGSCQSLMVSFGMILIAFKHGHSVELMYCQSIVSTLGLFFHVNFVKKITVGNKFIFLWDYSKCISIFKYSIYTWLSSLGGVLFGQVDRLLVGSVMGSESLGIYSAITSMTVQINSLSALPVQPILPKLSQFYCKSANSTIDARLMIKSALKINCMVAFGMGVIFLTFDSLILSTFLDAHSVLENTKNFQLATIIYTFYAVNAVGYYVCFGINAVNICMTVQILSGILSICLISLGLTYFGLTGGIVGNIGYWLVFLLTLLGFRKLNLNLSEWILWIVIPITIFVSSCMSTFLLKDYGLLKIAVGVVQLTCLIAWFFNSKSLIMSNSDSID